ncbi:MAG: sugar phosphate isomerase/epimerase family protein [Anaerolineae bacterium]
MNIGYVAAGPAVEALHRAARLGLDCIELNLIWGSESDIEGWSADDTRRVREGMAATGVTILSLCTGWANHLAPDKAGRERAAANMARALGLAAELGVPVVTCNAFGDPTVPPEEQVGRFSRVFGEYARWAEDRGLRIGIENCPHVHSEHGIQIGNIAYTPAMFERLFDAVPSRAVGMEYDPSHYFWLGVDYVALIRHFAERMVLVHAKDTEVLQDRLGWVGIYGTDWWRYRIPGMGMVNWEGIARALAEVGYRTGVIIEHEDPIYQADRFEEGISRGLAFLRQLFPNP